MNTSVKAAAAIVVAGGLAVTGIGVTAASAAEPASKSATVQAAPQHRDNHQQADRNRRDRDRRRCTDLPTRRVAFQEENVRNAPRTRRGAVVNVDVLERLYFEREYNWRTGRCQADGVDWKPVYVNTRGDRTDRRHLVLRGRYSRSDRGPVLPYWESFRFDRPLRPFSA